MRFASLASALATLSAASARIVGIQAPATLAPNSTFTLTLLTENYSQTVADVSVAWGYQSAPGYRLAVGGSAQSAYLGPDKSNTLDKVTVQATVPESLTGDAASGKVVLSAAVTSLYGATAGPTVTGFNVTVQVGEQTSEETVESSGSAWIINSEAY